MRKEPEESEAKKRYSFYLTEKEERHLRDALFEFRYPKPEKAIPVIERGKE